MQDLEVTCEKDVRPHALVVLERIGAEDSWKMRITCRYQVVPQINFLFLFVVFLSYLIRLSITVEYTKAQET